METRYRNKQVYVYQFIGMANRIVSIEPLGEELLDKLGRAGLNVTIVKRGDNMLTSLEKVDPEILICRDRDDVESIVTQCKNLRMLFTVEVGVEEMPFEILEKQKIRLANTSGISAVIMSTYAMSCILASVARLKENILNQQKNVWKRYQCTDSLQGRMLLIVGAGRTGKEIAKKAKPFGLHIVGIQRTPRKREGFDETGSLDNLNTYLRQADFVICTIPLTPSTYHLFTSERFELMKDNSVFVNISRGNIICENDLLFALNQGKMSQVYLDVFEKEPLPVDSALWNHPKVVISPHQAGRLDNYMSRAMELFIDNYNAFTKGEEMPNEVNLSQGY